MDSEKKKKRKKIFFYIFLSILVIGLVIGLSYLDASLSISGQKMTGSGGLYISFSEFFHDSLYRHTVLALFIVGIIVLFKLYEQYKLNRRKQLEKSIIKDENVINEYKTNDNIDEQKEKFRCPYCKSLSSIDSKICHECNCLFDNKQKVNYFNTKKLKYLLYICLILIVCIFIVETIIFNIQHPSAKTSSSDVINVNIIKLAIAIIGIIYLIVKIMQIDKVINKLKKEIRK